VGGECKHPVAEAHEKVAKMVGFVSWRVLSCILRNLLFLLFKSTHLGLIFIKRYACWVPYAAVFEIVYVKGDKVTMNYIGPGNW